MTVRNQLSGMEGMRKWLSAPSKTGWGWAWRVSNCIKCVKTEGKHLCWVWAVQGGVWCGGDANVLLLLPSHIHSVGSAEQLLYLWRITPVHSSCNRGKDCVFSSAWESPESWVSERYFIVVVKRNEGMWVWILPLSLLALRFGVTYWSSPWVCFFPLLNGNQNRTSCMVVVEIKWGAGGKEFNHIIWQTEELKAL